MADALCKSVRQIKTDMAALERHGLIRHTRRRRNSNIYSFLWHPIFEVQSAAFQRSGLKVQDSSLEVQDPVVLKVQSTAQEFSQLESCQLNSVKADQKRITGCASQKTRTAASAPLGLAQEPEPEPIKANREESISSPSGEGFVKKWTVQELALVRRKIVIYFGREPQEDFEISIMLRARGASAEAVCALLDRKFANGNLRPGGRLAPKSQNWFLTLVGNEFSPGPLPEPPAPPLPRTRAYQRGDTDSRRRSD
jgi:hypothetical protein